MSNFLFAIDEKAEAVLVSASPKGSTKIDFIERIGRKDNEVLYQAVAVLTQWPRLRISMTRSSGRWIRFVSCCMVSKSP